MTHRHPDQDQTQSMSQSLTDRKPQEGSRTRHQDQVTKNPRTHTMISQRLSRSPKSQTADGTFS